MDEKIAKVLDCFEKDVYSSSSCVGKVGIKEIKQYINDLHQQLNEKDKIIDEAIDYIKDHGGYYSKFIIKTYNYARMELSTDEVDELYEILKRGKSENNTN